MWDPVLSVRYGLLIFTSREPMAGSGDVYRWTAHLLEHESGAVLEG